MRVSEVRDALREAGIRPSRRRGQSFLLRDDLARRIADAAEGESILEVGPGLGALTRSLADASERLCCVEVSPALARRLRESEGMEGVEVVCGDFLEADPAALPGAPFDVLASNLPYSISTPALLRLLEPPLSTVKKAVVMLQREVARRVTAGPGSGDYCRLTLALWPQFTARRLLDAEPADFYPQPAVRSRVLVLTRREEPEVPAGLARRFSWVVRVGFSSRRKTLLNNLSAVMDRKTAADVLAGLGIDRKARAEELPPEAFVELAGEVAEP